jgi:hypothetical protein
MTTRLDALVLSATLLVASTIATAQTNPGDIAFTVPVNVTQLFPDIAKIRVTCGVESEAITLGRREVKGVLEPGRVSNAVELPVSGGQVVTSVNIVVSVAGVLENPTGKTARYVCSLDGYSSAQQTWKPFNHCMSSGTGNACTELVFRLSDFDRTANVGTFTW